ncbi:hypothetical protein LTR86_010840 [Recurvomyces mirabilis]|nr:hypothetical protein LTR86_010840 [Recurvomyces mirabilis]
MKNLYPNSELTGFDLASVVPNQPTLRRGIRHLMVDFEQPHWPVNEGSMDLIHMSNLCGSVSDWASLCATAYRYLTPGTGKLELVEFDWEPLCDDNTLPPSAPLHLWWQTMKQASAHNGRPIEYPHHLTRHLEQMGYEIEHNENIRIQSYEDYRDGDGLASRIARRYMLAMGRSPDEAGRPFRSFSGMSMELFTSVAQWTPEQVEQLQEDLYTPIQMSSVHLYHRL